MLTSTKPASLYAPDTSYGHFIDNQWVEGENGETIESINPANGAYLTRTPNGTADDVDRAVQAAARAFQSWRKTSATERSNALLKIADLFEADDAYARHGWRWPTAIDASAERVAPVLADHRHVMAGGHEFAQKVLRVDAHA